MVRNPVAQAIYASIEADFTPEQRGRMTLAVVLIGNDAASLLYVKFKRLACERLGIGFRLVHRAEPEAVTTLAVCQTIEALNQEPGVTGIIVQLPLPAHINKYAVLNAVAVKKDVDCFNAKNIARLYFGFEQARFVPATVFGIYRFLQHHQVETRGKLCVIVGKSNIVGKPLQLLLSDEDDMACTTVLCDKHTHDLRALTAQADILIVAAGKHHLVADASWIKKDAVVIDVGIHRTPAGIQGDVNQDAVCTKARISTPVPGGVGPMTVAALVYNTVRAYSLQAYQTKSAYRCTVS